MELKRLERRIGGARFRVGSPFNVESEVNVLLIGERRNEIPHVFLRFCRGVDIDDDIERYRVSDLVPEVASEHFILALDFAAISSPLPVSLGRRFIAASRLCHRKFSARRRG